MDARTLLLAGLVVVFASTLQTAVGFGGGLVTVPLLVGLGFRLPDAVALAAGTSLVQTAHGSYLLRARIRWREAFALAVPQWLCLPIGVACMLAIAGAGPAKVRAFVGALLVALLALRRLTPKATGARLGLGWGVLASATSGVLSGLSGMGGPPLVLFALAHGFEKDDFRAFLWSQFLLASPVFVAIMVVRTGPTILVPLAIGLGFAPLVWLGARLGLRISARWDAAVVTRAAEVTLLAIALASILAPGG